MVRRSLRVQSANRGARSRRQRLKEAPVQRDFSANRRNELWVADFTYLRCWEGLVYFSFVLDAYGRAIVGWQFAAHMRTDLVLDALRMALAMTDRVDEVQLVITATPAARPDSTGGRNTCLLT